MNVALKANLLRLGGALHALHALHGTRGLTVAIPALLLLTITEKALPAWVAAALVALAASVFVVALAMLPREGVAVLERAHALAEHPDAQRLIVNRLAWIVSLNLLLSPPLFLSVYGVPHLSPLTGIISGAAIQRLGAAYLFLVLWLAAMYVRRSRRAAPDLRTSRPSEMQARSRPAMQRQAFMLTFLVLGAAWLALTFSFWQPFGAVSPSQWIAFASPARAAAFAFTVTIPLLLVVAVAGHFEAWWYLRGRPIAWLVLAHVALCILAVVLHGRNLLTLGALQRAGFL